MVIPFAYKIRFKRVRTVTINVSRNGRIRGSSPKKYGGRPQPSKKFFDGMDKSYKIPISVGFGMLASSCWPFRLASPNSFFLVVSASRFRLMVAGRCPEFIRESQFENTSSRKTAQTLQICPNNGPIRIPPFWHTGCVYSLARTKLQCR